MKRSDVPMVLTGPELPSSYGQVVQSIVPDLNRIDMQARTLGGRPTNKVVRSGTNDAALAARCKEVSWELRRAHAIQYDGTIESYNSLD